MKEVEDIEENVHMAAMTKPSRYKLVCFVGMAEVFMNNCEFSEKNCRLVIHHNHLSK